MESCQNCADKRIILMCMHRIADEKLNLPPGGFLSVSCFESDHKRSFPADSFQQTIADQRRIGFSDCIFTDPESLNQRIFRKET